MMQTWFESKVKYMKVSESGSESMVTENFLLDAVSYTDAETRIIRQMQQIVRGGEFQIVDIKKSRIAEVFPYENGEWWFKAAINLVTIDEDAGKEKKIKTNYLIMADDIKEALNRLDESLEYLVIPFVVTSLAVSPIVDVFPYNPEEAQIPDGYVPVSVVEEKKNPIFTDGVNPFTEEEQEAAPAEEIAEETEVAEEIADSAEEKPEE
ncbi:DUF4494 domain-containing protein [Draconibacterium sp. IB214405]|uniref:DUF4494 domain-containing protein n=1 Tax=Draconibacterium sp. IB214405 TaxID=3097352 RepID=UPI002A179E3E|nr:DUF4494 domain-containing protein [Draconibacterium sp. IB214405]MDX8338415.1 DUF4494 domain-containing protein [Draconibacterium sp. IB214405]